MKCAIPLTVKASNLEARVEGLILSLVARKKLGALRHGVVAVGPRELDSISDRRIDGEGHEAEDTKSRGDHDGVSDSGAFGFFLDNWSSSVGSLWCTGILGNAF